MATTFTAKKMAAPVDSWFKRAATGKGVRIRYGKKTYMLFDAKHVPKSYAEREYGVTPVELDAFVEKMNAQAEKDRKAGRSKKFNGNIATSFEVELDPAFHESLRKRGRPASKIIGAAMRAAADFGDIRIATQEAHPTTAQEPIRMPLGFENAAALSGPSRNALFSTGRKS